MDPIVIVGAGMAGYTLARELRKANAEVDILMVSADAALNYAKPTLSNALSAQKKPVDIPLADAMKMQQQLRLEILACHRVVAIDPQQHQIHLDDQTQIIIRRYSKLVLALGAHALRPSLTGDAADDIFTANHLEEYAAFRAQLDQGNTAKRVLIIGGGLIGCEFANDLHAQPFAQPPQSSVVTAQHHAIVVNRSEQLLDRLIPPIVAQHFQQSLEHIGIEFRLNNQVIEINRHPQGYAVRLATDEVILVDLVLAAIGLGVDLRLAQQAGLVTGRGIMTDTMLATNLTDIYALGDCAQVDGVWLPYVMPLMQQAKALAKTLNGEPTPVQYPVMPIAVKTPAAPMTIVPTPHDCAVTWQLEALADGMIARAIDQSNRLRGFVLLGAQAAKQRLTLTQQLGQIYAG